MAKGGSSSSFFTLFVTGLLLATVPFLVEFLTRKTFPVHEKGAVLVTGASSGIGHHAATTLAARRPGILVYAGVRKDSDAQAITDLGIPNLRYSKGANHPILLPVR